MKFALDITIESLRSSTISDFFVGGGGTTSFFINSGVWMTENFTETISNAKMSINKKSIPCLLGDFYLNAQI